MIQEKNGYTEIFIHMFDNIVFDSKHRDNV